MIKQLFNIIFLTILVMTSCQTLKIPVGGESKIIKGKLVVVDEKTEPLIGATVYEYGDKMNGAITNTNGEFELKFNNETLLCVVTSFYEPIIFTVKPDKRNLIFLNDRKSKQSKKIWKYLKK